MQKVLYSQTPESRGGKFEKKLPLDERLMLRLKESQDAVDKAHAASYAKMLAYAQLHMGKCLEFKKTAAKYRIASQDRASIMNDFLEIKIVRNDVGCIRLAIESDAIQGWQLINMLLRTKRHIHLSQIAKQRLFCISSYDLSRCVSTYAMTMVLRMDELRLEGIREALHPPPGPNNNEDLAAQLLKHGEHELSSLVGRGLLEKAALSRAYGEKFASIGRLIKNGFVMDILGSFEE